MLPTARVLLRLGCGCACMLTPMTIEKANRMNTETMLFKIDIFFLQFLELGPRFFKHMLEYINCTGESYSLIDETSADAERTTSSASLENYKAAQEEGC